MRLHAIKRRLGRIPVAVPAYHIARSLWLYPSFVRDFLRFRRLARGDRRFPVTWLGQSSRLFERTATTPFTPDYLYHPAWAARVIARTRPARHVDISSVLHFSTLVSAFVPVDFYDYRPAAVRLDNLACGRVDLRALPFADDSIESLSCMHVIEHVGLGRYGDPLDPRGDLEAIAELRRVLAPGGTLLLVTPVGRSRLEFNAHRVYGYDQIVTACAGLVLEEYALIPDDALAVGMIPNATAELTDDQEWGCGCFRFTK